MQTFEGKTAFITGAASGIGLALAEKAASERMNVVLADVEEQALSLAVRKIEERQVRAIGVPVNTMLAESVSAAAERAIAEFGRVHLVFNNAGVASTRSAGKALWEVPDQDWDWVMGVNFYGVLYGIRAFVPHMLEHGEPSHIVNTASLAGVLPGGGT
ncbi:MAG TPA: SDR family NAD(P)-dependent oxidoreductase, partial [Pseudomonadales bacterium]